MTDWIPHDGQDCPVPPDSCPAVRFRRNGYGMRSPLTIQMGTTAAHKWENYGDRNCWQWLPGSNDGQDIIAYKPEPDDWVTIPHFPDSVSV